MTEDPIARLPADFGRVLARLRADRKWSEEALATAVGLSGAGEVARIERGEREPTLTEIFRIARALGDPPTILLIDVISSWRADPIGEVLYKSRASDFARLYRLGYHHDPGEFREHTMTYYSIEDATAWAIKLNLTRRKRGQKPLDTVCIYVRLGYVSFA
jgi:transcriptional regulator with XRE-family HTH domain